MEGGRSVQDLLQVGLGDGEDVLVGGGFQGGDPVRLTGDDALKEVSHVPGVAEVLVPLLVELV